MLSDKRINEMVLILTDLVKELGDDGINVIHDDAELFMTKHELFMSLSKSANLATKYCRRCIELKLDAKV